MFLCKPRGRPRAYDPDTVLDQAAELFWRKGFAATTLDDLVAATGVNRPSLYAGFGDKEAIYLKAMAHLQQIIANILSRGLVASAQDTSFRDVLERYFATVIDLYLGEGDASLGCPLFCTAVAEAATEPTMQALLSSALHGLDGFIESALLELQAGGHLPDRYRPTDLAPAMAAIQLSLAMRARAKHGRAALE